MRAFKNFLSPGRLFTGTAVGAACALWVFSGLTGCVSRTLTGLTVEPATGDTCVVPGVAAQFHAYGTYTESGHAAETEDITDNVTWSATIPAVSTVNSSGLATGMNPGITSIIATTQGEFGNLTAVSNITVQATSCSTTPAVRPATALSLIPGDQTLHVGNTAQFLAVAGFASTPLTADRTHQVAWNSSNPKVAIVSALGQVTAVGPGDAIIAARTQDADGNLISASQTIHSAAGEQDPDSQPVLRIAGAGSGAGTVLMTATALDGSAVQPVACSFSRESQNSTPSRCVSPLTVGTLVTLTAMEKKGSIFDGWAGNCTPVTGSPKQCTITVNDNASVGAIFDLQ